MFNSAFLRLIGLSAFWWSGLALAQAPAEPAHENDDDLEVPAGPSPPPEAERSTAVPSSPPAVPVTAPPTSPKTPEVPLATEPPSELHALRERLARLEQAESLGKKSPGLQPVRGLEFSGYLQAQFEASQLSEDQLQQGGSPLNQNRFLLRRARLRALHEFRFASALLELDANTVRGVSVGVRRAEGALFYRGANPAELPPLVVLTVGVTDLPFGHELAEPTRARYFMERSQASLALFPTEMDVGVKLSGAVAFVRYGFAIANGEPVDTLTGRLPRDPNSAKDITGRVGVELSPAPTLRLSGGTSFSRGTGFHAGTQASKSGFAWTDDNEDGKLQNSEIIGVPGTAASPSRNFKRWAYGLDLSLALKTMLGVTQLYGEAYVASNYDRGLYIADPVQGGTDVREAGGYLALIQNVTEYGVVGFRYSVYDPNSDFFDQRRGKLIPTSARISTFSPLVGLELRGQARLLFQYDFVRDRLARDATGVPTDSKNDLATLRLQVEL